jgi:uncharacterized lipoprotein YddW (UPF0748 family)
LFDLIKDTDIKHIFVQVRGRGDSYYSSDFEPTAYDVPYGFDPLKYLIEKTGKSDIKIHAWINVTFVLNADDHPSDSRHILSRHPEWVTYDHSGRPMTDYSKKELDKNLLEGYFLDPAIPEVKDYIESIVKDILSKYPVGGIHLDFIRYPYSGYNSYYGKYFSDFGYNPAAREIFKKEHGIDPVNIDRHKDSPEKDLFDKFRRDQITDIVKRISSIVKSKDKNLILSAAVMPRYDRGRKVYFQDWPAWLEGNYIDLACVMSYSSSTAGFQNYIKYANDTGNIDRIFMGISVKKNTKIKTALEQIDLTYRNGIRGYSIFSFNHEKNFIEDLSELIKYERSIYKY